MRILMVKHLIEKRRLGSYFQFCDKINVHEEGNELTILEANNIV